MGRINILAQLYRPSTLKHSYWDQEHPKLRDYPSSSSKPSLKIGEESSDESFNAFRDKYRWDERRIQLKDKEWNKLVNKQTKANKREQDKEKKHVKK